MANITELNINLTLNIIKVVKHNKKEHTQVIHNTT